MPRDRVAARTDSFPQNHGCRRRRRKRDDSKPARLQSKRVALDTTDRVFSVINRFRDQPGTRFKGVRVEIGEGENTVTVRFQEREVTAAIIVSVTMGSSFTQRMPCSTVW